MSACIECSSVRGIRDAAGRVPVPQTAYESAWGRAVASGTLQRAIDTLQERRALPLDQKIEASLARIRDWHEAWDGAVSVSYSGGKDSSVLLWLVRQAYPEAPAVFCHTGLEYPEVVQTVLATPNCTIIRPKMRFREVICRYGWPIASKKLARGISVLRHPTGRNQNIYRLYDQGINRFGQPVNGRKVSDCWRFLVDAPFEVSDHCCEVMKKEPMRRYRRETGLGSPKARRWLSGQSRMCSNASAGTTSLWPPYTAILRNATGVWRRQDCGVPAACSAHSVSTWICGTATKPGSRR